MSSYRFRSRSSNGNVKKKQTINQLLFEYPPPTNSKDPKCQATNKISFTMHDRRRLQSPNFLNDTIISFFMQLYLDNDVSKKIKKRIHVFNSFFYSKIKSIREHDLAARKSTSSASRWIKDIDIFEKDFLILPICEKDHWLLVIICYPANYPSSDSNILPDNKLYEPAVIILNSWTGCGPGIKKVLSSFLRLRWITEKKTPREFPISNAKKSGIRLLFPELPQQKNNYNCGIFVLNYFYCFLKNPRGSYLRIYRKRSLIDWFTENSIDVGRERVRMADIVKQHTQSWAETSEIHKVRTEDPEEIHIDSSRPNSVDLVDSDEQDSVIWIQ